MYSNKNILQIKISAENTPLNNFPRYRAYYILSEIYNNNKCIAF